MRGIPTCYVISIHSPLAGRDNNRSLLSYDIGISIHSPLAGRDLALTEGMRREHAISIHSPLAGRDCEIDITINIKSQFQSTRPSRGETLEVPVLALAQVFQSTRPSRGETVVPEMLLSLLIISIHSPLAGRDPDRDQHTVQQSLYFNPLAPRGARPAEAPTVDRNGQISIHSPLAGRDPAGAYIIDPLGISIHSPLAGRDRNLDPVLRKLLISIHSPLAGRDKLGVSHVTVLNWISIHSPLAGRD